jgi:hypothetical protein
MGDLHRRVWNRTFLPLAGAQQPGLARVSILGRVRKGFAYRASSLDPSALPALLSALLSALLFALLSARLLALTSLHAAVGRVANRHTALLKSNE